MALQLAGPIEQLNIWPKRSNRLFKKDLAKLVKKMRESDIPPPSDRSTKRNLAKRLGWSIVNTRPETPWSSYAFAQLSSTARVEATTQPRSMPKVTGMKIPNVVNSQTLSLEILAG